MVIHKHPQGEETFTGATVKGVPNVHVIVSIERVRFLRGIIIVAAATDAIFRKQSGSRCIITRNRPMAHSSLPAWNCIHVFSN